MLFGLTHGYTDHILIVIEVADEAERVAALVAELMSMVNEDAKALDRDQLHAEVHFRR